MASQGTYNDWIKFNTRVANVAFDDKKFIVKTQHDAKETVEEFDWAIVATGHYSFPLMPSNVKGIDSFKGLAIHSRDLRDAAVLKNLKVLCVGGGFSGLDIAIQTAKFGAKSVTVSTDKPGRGFQWPNDINEKPIMSALDGQRATFIDGSHDDFDAIIWCTGYQHKFPFLSDNLKLETSNQVYPAHLYKGVVFTKAAKSKLFYIGMQNLVYSFPMFDLQAMLILKYISNELPLPSETDMKSDNDDYSNRLVNHAMVFSSFS